MCSWIRPVIRILVLKVRCRPARGELNSQYAFDLPAGTPEASSIVRVPSDCITGANCIVAPLERAEGIEFLNGNWAKLDDLKRRRIRELELNKSQISSWD
jgi:hypothetical protein